METLNLVQKTTKWTLDSAHSELTFKVKHLMISNVKGQFRNFDVVMVMGNGDISNADIEVIVETGSISTNNTDRDNHLRSEDFFDVNNYPELRFRTNSIHEVYENNYRMNGLLSLKGVSKEVSLDVEFGGYVQDPYGNEKAGFSVRGKINRKDFGLNWNSALEAGGVMVGDEVRLSAEVQMVKQS